jgi:hypothetical protein
MILYIFNVWIALELVLIRIIVSSEFCLAVRMYATGIHALSGNSASTKLPGSNVCRSSMV